MKLNLMLHEKNLYLSYYYEIIAENDNYNH